MPTPIPTAQGRTLTYCGDKFGQCLFSKRQAADEGLPVVVVDEEIYRRLPTLLIATVDKFAQMPWKGEVQMLFGQVNGYLRAARVQVAGNRRLDLPPEIEAGLPAAKTLEHAPLRPPDLIIQDELHLISGPLGTLVGLYETAIDKLCTWEVNGKEGPPEVDRIDGDDQERRRAGSQPVLADGQHFPAARTGCAGQLLLGSA